MGSDSSRFRYHLVPLCLLAAVSAAVFGQALSHQFLVNWDDHLYVLQNPAVRGISFENLLAAFTRFYVGNYAPVQIISYMIDHAVWGLRPAGFILTNLVLHTLNGLLVYLLLFRCTGSRLGSTLGGLLFLAHPVQVESAVWISQRKNLLAMLFFLAAFLLYQRSRRAGSAGTGSYSASVGAFVVALLAKSVAVILPPALILWDVSEGEAKKRLRDTIPFFLAAALVGVVALYSQSPENQGGRTGWHGGTPWTNLLTMTTLLPRYLVLLFWPRSLSAVYDVPVHRGIDAEVVGGIVVLAAAGAAGWWLWKGAARRPYFFWYALFFLALLPVSQIVPLTTLMNDRYLYFPLLGLAGLVAVGSDRLAARFSPPVIGVAGGTVVAALAVVSLLRVPVWHDSVTLWSDAAAKYPDNKLIWRGLGDAYARRKDYDRALPAFREALRIDPGYGEILNNVGSIYLLRKDYDNAYRYLKEATDRSPDYALGFENLGDLYFRTGRLSEARGAALRALELNPRSVQALSILGRISLRERTLDDARKYFGELRRLMPKSASVCYYLACVESLAGRPDDALGELRAAVQLGFRDGALLMEEPDLAGVRSHPGFAALIRELSAMSPPSPSR